MSKKCNCLFYCALIVVSAIGFSCNNESVTVGREKTCTAKINISGVFPELAMVADHVPRTEAGIGAMAAWADRLWLVTYVAHKKETGSGTGLYEIDKDFNIRKRPESVVGTYANRFIHGPSNQLIIGPHIIDTQGNVRTIEELKDHRLTATMMHLTDPKNKVYFLAMEGEMFEVNVRSLHTKLLFDLTKELELPAEAQPHWKGGFTAHGRVIVANNTYDERDYLRQWQAGRLAEWEGKQWKILEKTSFMEVWCPRSFGWAIYATGWDNRSAILKVFKNGRWRRYRLPKASYSWDGTSSTEWMRIREVETQRGIMDLHGMFYEIPYHSYGGHIFGIQPICRHLRVVPDFCTWRGLLVLGGNQVSSMGGGNGNDRNVYGGQPQSGLWFGKTDDLWSFGKPGGAGGVWRDDNVKAGQVSDPFLINGFDKKIVHFKHDADTEVTFTLEVDILGDGNWSGYRIVTVGTEGYDCFIFPDGFNAEWIRVGIDTECKTTVYFMYN